MYKPDQWVKLLVKLIDKTKAEKIDWSWDPNDFARSTLIASVSGTKFSISSLSPLGPFRLELWDEANGLLIGKVDGASHRAATVMGMVQGIEPKLKELYGAAAGSSERINDKLREVTEILGSL